VNFEKIMVSNIKFSELMELTRPYRTSETLEELGEAKRIIDEFSDLQPESFTEEEHAKITRISVRLMREIENLIQLKYGPPSFEGEDDEDDPDVIYIPAGRKVSDPFRKS
jgi:hypothetical protein